MSNFEFLRNDYPALADFGGLAERYYKSDPNSCLMKLGMMSETIVRLIYQIDGIEPPTTDKADQRIIKLRREDYITDDLESLFHILRKKRNLATHENYSSEEDARAMLPIAHSLAEWFYETYGDYTYQHHEFIFSDAAEEPVTDKKAEEAKDEKRAAEALNNAKSVPKVNAIERKRRSYQAASQRARTEDETRQLIDEALSAVGWEADTHRLRYSLGTRPKKGKDLAIAEWPITKPDGSAGRVDYALFCGFKLVGMIEAKAESKNLPSVFDYQGKEYPASVREQDTKYTVGEWGKYRVPFMFAANGRPYLAQYETASGVWFRDLRDESNAPKPLHGWMGPDGLLRMIDDETAEAEKRLAALPYDVLTDPDGLNLYYYQLNAVKATENAIRMGKRAILIAMATGTGKTRTVLAMIYRFLKTRRFRRILFLVDRNVLGKQAGDTFADVRLEALMALNKLYNVKGITDDAEDDKETSLRIATVQSIVKRILYHGEGKMPAVNDYDLVIIDEAHRGYILDKEMTDSEAVFSDQRDYISKYRAVIDYFDAVKIALTATPALHTTKIFGEPVYTYSYREAVVDGALVDHDPPIQIHTKLRDEGIHYKKGDSATTYDPLTGEVKNGALIEDELDFDVDSFNRLVITESFTRAVLEFVAEHIDPDDEQSGKTLIFAATDKHADMIVTILKEIFGKAGKSVESVMKITGSVANGNQDAIQAAVRQFKNEKYPSVVVTVDLLTTGVDVRSITALVFLRFVRSRILFEQMLGRATRLCKEIHKEKFVIYDAVGVCEVMWDMSAMKPVVASPNITFEKLAEGLKAVADADEEHLKARIETMRAKLQRKLKNISEKDAETFAAMTGGTTIKELADSLAKLSPAEGRERILKLADALVFLDGVKGVNRPVIIIDDNDDQVTRTTITLPDKKSPADYIEEFTAWVKNHRDQITAVNIICTSPKELTRQQLKDLRRLLDKDNFSENNLNKAQSAVSRSEVAADIISHIRRSAFGAPLMTHAERIERAVSRETERLKAEGTLTPEQEQFLSDVKEYFLHDPDYIISPQMIDEDRRFERPFKNYDKMFGGRLTEILARINANLYDEGGESA